MPHHHEKKITSIERYSSNSSDSSDRLQAHQPTQHPVAPQSAQTNYGLFQTVQLQNNNKIDQSKEKTTCCDCLFGWMFKK